MNPETKQVETDLPKVEVKVEEAGAITKITTPDTSADGWQSIRDQVLQIISELPDYVSGFFSSYQRPIITIGLLFGGLVSIKVVLAVLDAINDVPLLAPTFELIGLGYSAWFVNRYLLRAANRQELSSELTSLKDQVVGDQYPKS